METNALTATELRVIIAIIGVIVLVLIYYFGRPRKPGQGQRRATKREPLRVEPVLGTPDAEPDDPSAPADARVPVAPADATTRLSAADSTAGQRPPGQIERIVSLYISAAQDDMIAGSDLVVAAEKAGLVFGDRSIFHRLISETGRQGPVFSMASMVQPGSFDLAQLGELETPGVTLFMTLPGPLSALDAWDMMLPTAQRLAELLDGVLLDEKHNALSRQRIAHVRDELRAWDRRQEQSMIRPS